MDHYLGICAQPLLDRDCHRGIQGDQTFIELWNFIGSNRKSVEDFWMREPTGGVAGTGQRIRSAERLRLLVVRLESADVVELIEVIVVQGIRLIELFQQIHGKRHVVAVGDNAHQLITVHDR